MQPLRALNMCAMAFNVQVDILELMFALDGATLVLGVSADHREAVARSRVVGLRSELELRLMVRALLQIVVYEW